MAGFASQSVQYLDVGLKLEVEPSIYLQDEIAIKVLLEVSSITREEALMEAVRLTTRGRSAPLVAASSL